MNNVETKLNTEDLVQKIIAANKEHIFGLPYLVSNFHCYSRIQLLTALLDAGYDVEYRLLGNDTAEILLKEKGQ